LELRAYSTVFDEGDKDVIEASGEMRRISDRTAAADEVGEELNVICRVYPFPRRDLRETGDPSATSLPGAARMAMLSARRSASSRN